LAYGGNRRATQAGFLGDRAVGCSRMHNPVREQECAGATASSWADVGIIRNTLQDATFVVEQENKRASSLS